MSPERMQYLIIKDEIEKLPVVDRTKVDGIANDIRKLLDAAPEHALMALALVGAEFAAKE